MVFTFRPSPHAGLTGNNDWNSCPIPPSGRNSVVTYLGYSYIQLSFSNFPPSFSLSFLHSFFSTPSSS